MVIYGSGKYRVTFEQTQEITESNSNSQEVNFERETNIIDIYMKCCVHIMTKLCESITTIL